MTVYTGTSAEFVFDRKLYPWVESMKVGDMANLERGDYTYQFEIRGVVIDDSSNVVVLSAHADDVMIGAARRNCEGY